MFDVIISTLKSLAPYIAAIAIVAGIFMAYKYFTKKSDVALTTQPESSLSPPEMKPLLAAENTVREPKMEHRIIGGIQEGDECPDCNEKLVISPFSKIVCNNCKVVYGLV